MRVPAVSLFLFVSLNCLAGEDSNDTACRKWYIPDHFQLQFAGNIGFVSGGLGFGYAKSKLETDLMYGFVPGYFGGPLHSFTLKQAYIPFRPIKAGSYSVDIFTTGLVFNYTPGKQFFFSATSREEYPKNYYDYSSALRIGFFVGGRVHRKLTSNCFDKVGLYYELGTYDLAVHNYMFNVSKSSFKGMFSLALGVKLFLKN